MESRSDTPNLLDDPDAAFFSGLKKWHVYELEALKAYLEETTEKLHELRIESQKLDDILYHMTVRKGMIEAFLEKDNPRGQIRIKK